MTSETTDGYVASCRIGDATVTVISEGTFPWKLDLQAPEFEWRRAMPEANAAGEVVLGDNVVHIRLGSASILVDPGFADPSEPPPAHFPGLTRSPGLHAGLAMIGVTPEQITHVVITHAHSDHFMGVTVERDGERLSRFPHARHLLGRPEWDGNPERAQPDSSLMIHLGTIARLGLLDLVDGLREVVPGVTVIPAPGETPGHSIVRLRSRGETCFVLGDLFHHACEVSHLDWVSPGRDRAAMRASREQLIADAVPSRAILIYTHAPFPGWGRIVPEAGSYVWQPA